VHTKAVAEQGLEEGEEDRGGRGAEEEEVEEVGLGWMEACCTALELHAAEPDVQVGPEAPFPWRSTCFPRCDNGV